MTTDHRAGGPYTTGLWAGTKWRNPPPRWSMDPDGVLPVVTGPATDFWRSTFHGFERQRGHALLRPVDGPFKAVLTVGEPYRKLFDQAGLMLRAFATAWIKLGIELTDGATHLSCGHGRGGGRDLRLGGHAG